MDGHRIHGWRPKNGQKRALDSLELGLQMTWAIESVLGTEPEPHRATRALDCEPPLQPRLLFFLLWWNTQQKQLGGGGQLFLLGRKEGLLLTQIQKHSPSPVRKSRPQELNDSWRHCIQSQEVARDECFPSLSFSFREESGPWNGAVHIQRFLSASTNPTEKLSHRHT